MEKHSVGMEKRGVASAWLRQAKQSIGKVTPGKTGRGMAQLNAATARRGVERHGYGNADRARYWQSIEQ